MAATHPSETRPTLDDPIGQTPNNARFWLPFALLITRSSWPAFWRCLMHQNLFRLFLRENHDFRKTPCLIAANLDRWERFSTYQP